MLKTIIILIGLIFLLFSVIGIYDARKITLNHFSNGEINTATKTIKIVSFIVAIISMGIIYLINVGE